MSYLDDVLKATSGYSALNASSGNLLDQLIASMAAPPVASSSKPTGRVDSKGNKITAIDPSKDLTTIKLSNGQKATVNKKAANAFSGFLNELTARGYKWTSSGGYVDRDIRGRPGVKSQHALGLAMDINASTNPMRDDGKLITNMPPWIGSLAAKYGLSWGGAWTGSRKDPMHFEYKG